MKLSLAWIFDHLEADVSTYDVAQIVERISETTAEVESWYQIDLDLFSLTLAHIVEVDSSGIDVHIPEDNKDIRLPYREDVRAGHYCFLRKDNDHYVWASMHDFASAKDTLLPLIYADSIINAHTWRFMIEKKDYVLEIDNKSITHRPDLWSHRGFARELATLYDLKLKPLEHFVAPMEVQHFTGNASPVNQTGPTITIQDTSLCNQLASSLIETIAWSPSRIPMLTRLCRIDSKPINILIDSTNYVMFDIGQPMHAFDAEKIREHQLIVRKARVGERIRLLDDQLIELTTHDGIIADNKQPVSLAGIMGGADSAVTIDTRSLLLEAGSFDAATIRLTATRHKKRTDAAIRYEKSLDPLQPQYAIKRFMHLLNENSVPHTSEGHVVVVGPQPEKIQIQITHFYIEQRLGTSIDTSFITKTLEHLSFAVSIAQQENDVCYTIEVPSWRATKDIHIKEDIVEEIGRFFGYKHIKNLPLMGERHPVDTQALYRQRMIKRIMSMSLQMKEVYSYAFFDESKLRDYAWEPQETLEALQPVSANWRRLVTTLTPTHLNIITENVGDTKQMRFFEWARIWHKNHEAEEKVVLAGIFFDQDDNEDFYTYKALLSILFDAIKIPVTWKRVDDATQPWFIAHQTAHIVCEGYTLGTMGMINDEWRTKIAPSGTIGVFELDAHFMQTYQVPITHYMPTSRYPDIHRDVSMLVSLSITAQTVQTAIKHAHPHIILVELIDFFQKPEWTDKKSLTFKYIIRDMHKTMTTQEIDAITDLVYKAVQAFGAEIR